MKCPKCGYIRKPEDTSPDYECPRCGVIYAKYSREVEEQREILEAKARELAAREKKRAEANAPSALNSADGGKISAQDLICTTCGSVGEYHETRPGSSLVEVILWLWMIIPGALYSAWRSSKKSAVCAVCGGRTLIKVETPVGRQVLEKTSPSLQVANIPPRKPIETAGQKAANRLSKWVLYFLIFSAVSLFGLLVITMRSR